MLVFTGHEAADDLHYLYGVLPLPVSLLAEAARAGAAQQEIGDLDFESLPEDRQRPIALAIVRREMGIMAVSCIVIFFLALRAAGDQLGVLAERRPVARRGGRSAARPRALSSAPRR